MACVLALGSLSDRMEKWLNQQSRDFMAGGKEVPEEWLEQVRADVLQVVRQMTFMIMTFAGDTPQLA